MSLLVARARDFDTTLTTDEPISVIANVLELEHRDANGDPVVERVGVVEGHGRTIVIVFRGVEGSDARDHPVGTTVRVVRALP